MAGGCNRVAAAEADPIGEQQLKLLGSTTLPCKGGRGPPRCFRFNEIHRPHQGLRWDFKKTCRLMVPSVQCVIIQIQSKFREILAG